LSQGGALLRLRISNPKARLQSMTGGSMKAITAGVGLLIVSGVLAYGYWFGVTHGSLYITLMDISDREHPLDARPVQLVFRDSTVA
jgi:hypothetical protein